MRVSSRYSPSQPESAFRLADLSVDGVDVSGEIVRFQREGHDEVAQHFGYIVRQGRIDHGRVVRDLGDRDRVRRLVVDVCPIELITDRAAAEQEQDQAKNKYVSITPSHIP